MARTRSIANSLAGLFATSVQPIYAVDEQRRIVYCNPACAAWTGVESDQLTQQRCDYHSSAEATGTAAIAAALCPPPEAFGGARHCGTITFRRASDGLTSRRAEFIPLAGEPLEGVGVLILVERQDTAKDNPADSDNGNEAADLHHRLMQIRHELAERYQIDQLIGDSYMMRRVRDQIEVAVETESNVTIIGPPGSGRERVSRTIYYSDYSPAFGHVVSLSCSLLDAELLQSTITEFVRRREDESEQGRGALILLDVDELAADAQTELAGFLHLPKFRLRLIATARESLLSLADQEQFRDDLAYALSTLVIELPRLAERPQDLPLLAQHFLEQWNAKGGRQLSGFAPEAVELLAEYDWPENIDELAGAIGQACAKADGPLIYPQDLPEVIHLATEAGAAARRPQEKIVLDAFLAEIEKELIERALRRAKGNKAKAARMLGISRARLHRRLEQLGLA